MAAHPAGGTTIGRGGSDSSLEQFSSVLLGAGFHNQLHTKKRPTSPACQKQRTLPWKSCAVLRDYHTSAVVTLPTPGCTHQLHLVGGDGDVEGVMGGQLCSSVQRHLTAIFSEAPGSVTLLEQQVF